MCKLIFHPITKQNEEMIKHDHTTEFYQLTCEIQDSKVVLNLMKIWRKNSRVSLKYCILNTDRYRNDASLCTLQFHLLKFVLFSLQFKLLDHVTFPHISIGSGTTAGPENTFKMNL